MSAGVAPLARRPPLPGPAESRPGATDALRLPEDRAFDVPTINTRLARMAAQAAPRTRRPRLRT